MPLVRLGTHPDGTPELFHQRLQETEDRSVTETSGM